MIATKTNDLFFDKSSQQSCRQSSINSNNCKARTGSQRQQDITSLSMSSTLGHSLSEACSSRSTPKPRPPSPTTRPNITFQTYACPEAYAKWYCLNGATCFSVRIGESILYNCECADGYMGQRCEFKDLDGSYLPSREKVLVETASIAGGVTVAVLLMVIITVFYYTYLRHRKKEQRLTTIEINMDQIERRPFGRVHALRSASIRNSMSYNYGDDNRFADSNRLHDLESGDNIYVFKQVLSPENVDQNHDH
ncbi:protein spitz-like [Oppia nitens]|uniref:protein spitz-like n=1 Tax=Oppia nitens TaxID=1686743 RepID=UPI0023D9F35B|nr:protein spitz-like [Oppia nitens]